MDAEEGKATQKLAVDYVGMVNRVIWLTLHKCDDFIETPLKEEQFEDCLELHKKFLEEGKKKQS